MDKKLVVANIGMQFGRAHIEGALSAGAEIGALCDCDEKALAFAGEKYNVPEEKRFTDYKELLSNPEIDAVTIAVPDQLHKKLSIEFLKAGKHVLCEKPLALTREDTVEIIKAAKESNCKFMVGQICRFTPAFIKAKQLVSSGVIGDIYFIESEYAHDYMYLVDKWRSDPLRHGVIGGGCHAVDLMRWIAGDPTEVMAYGTHKLLPNVPYDDATIAIMKFPNDVIGKVFVSTGCKRTYTMRTLIYGTKGTIICDNTSPTMELFTIGEDQMAHEAEIIDIEVNNHNAGEEFRVFMDAIVNDTDVLTDATEGAKTVEVCRSIVKSCEKGLPVNPDYNF